MLYSASRCHHPVYAILYLELSLNLEFEFCKTVSLFLNTCSVIKHTRRGSISWIKTVTHSGYDQSKDI